MATEILERLAIKALEEDGLGFREESDREVAITIATEDGTQDFHIVDRCVVAMPTLSIGARHFVRFPLERRGEAVLICNEMNRLFAGKFTLNPMGDVTFSQDFILPDTAGPREFRLAFGLAEMTFFELYKPIMAVRWTGASLDDALDAWRASGDEEDDADDDPTMTDDDIDRLMSR